MTAKAFISQLHDAARASQGLTPTILGIACTRFWLQGIIVGLVPDGTRCMIDDGTGVAAIDLRTFQKSIPNGMAQPLRLGNLIMVIGPLVRRSTTLSPTDSDADGVRTILAHQIIDVSAQPQQDSIWFLEVIEYWKIATG